MTTHAINNKDCARPDALPRLNVLSARSILQTIGSPPHPLTLSPVAQQEKDASKELYPMLAALRFFFVRILTL